MSAISVTNLSKTYRVHSRSSGLYAALKGLVHRQYKSVEAVKQISFSIDKGACVGFLGPNGAGKTTTLKMLAGLLVPTEGTLRVLDFTPHQRKADFLRSIMLVAGQKNQLLWDLPPVDTFDLNRAVYGIADTDFKTRLDELVSLLNIGDVIKKPTRQLSLGERMKCELAAALLHKPSILFLDEPTIGLDVNMQTTVRQFLRDYNRRHGATVLLTSHNMDDVSALCERVLIINFGRIVYDGSLRELVKRTRPEKRLTLHWSEAIDAHHLDAIGTTIEKHDRHAVLQIAQNKLRAAIEYALQHTPVADLTVENAPLEEVLADVFAQTPTRS